MAMSFFFFRSDQTMIALYGAIYRKAHSFPTPKFDVMNGEILVHDKKKIFGIFIVPSLELKITKVK